MNILTLLLACGIACEVFAAAHVHDPITAESAQTAVSSTSENGILLVTTLDGRVTALHLDSGRPLWSVDTGGSLIRSHLGDESENQATGARVLSPLLIPSRDGSIMLETPSGLQQLPYRAQELVAALPFSSGAHLLLGSKSSFALGIDPVTGHVVRRVRGATQVDGPQGSHEETETSAPRLVSLLWLTRTEYFVQAYDASLGREVWNLTYAQAGPPDRQLHRDSLLREQGSRADAVASMQQSTLDDEIGQELPSLSIELTTFMNGELVASEPLSGAWKWTGPPLNAPVTAVHRVQWVDAGKIIHVPVEFTEIWPAVAGKNRRHDTALTLVGGQHDNTRGSSAHQSDSNKRASASVFIGALPDGQLYAAPRTGRTKVVHRLVEAALVGSDTVQETDAITSTVSGTEEVLFLPAPHVSVASQHGIVQSNAAANNMCRQLNNEGDTSNGDEGHSNSASCLVGLHNVSFVEDYSFYDSISATGVVWQLPAVARQWLDAGRAEMRRVAKGPSFSFGVAPDMVLIPTSSSGTGTSQRLEQLDMYPLVLTSIILFATSMIAVLYRVVWPWLKPQDAPRMIQIDNSEMREAALSRNDASMGIQIVKLVTAPTERLIGNVLHRLVGRLAVSDFVLGTGSQGTVVFRGHWDGRSVAVKRLLRTFHPSAAREVELLIQSDGHAAVVRYFACEVAADFTYLALELCECSLADALGKASRAGARAAAREVARKVQNLPARSKIGRIGGRGNGVSLLRDDEAEEEGSKNLTGSALIVPTAANHRLPPAPSAATREFLHAIVSGVAHLHAHGIVHRDLKPHNILLSRTSTVIGSGKGAGSLKTAQPAPFLHIDTSVGGAIDRQSRELHGLGLYFMPKISDFGLGKQMERTEREERTDDATPIQAGHVSSNLQGVLARRQRALEGGHSSVSAAAPGSSGWQAPEIIRPVLLPYSSGNGTDVGASAASCAEEVDCSTPLQTPFVLACASDVWSLGCVLYSVLDPDPTGTGVGGGHPFGQPFERESAILRYTEQPVLSRLESVCPEADAIVRAMLHPKPQSRPSAQQVAEHVFFWTDARKLHFLCDLSDRIEDEQEGSPLLMAVEATASQLRQVSPGIPFNWSSCLSGDFVADTQPGKYRRYDTGRVCDLLRLVRNRRHHYRDLPLSTRVRLVGSEEDSAALVPFLSAQQRFPGLLLAMHEVVCTSLAHEAQWAAALGTKTAASWERISREAVAVFVGGKREARKAQLQPPGQVGIACFPRPGVPLSASRYFHPDAANHGIIAARSWYPDEEGWSHAAAGVYSRCVEGSGGPLLVETADSGGEAAAGVGLYSNQPQPSAFRPNPGVVRVVCAHITVSEGSYKGGAHVDHPRYKCAPCKDWDRSGGRRGGCARGSRCDFAHGAVELRASQARFP